MNAKSFVDTNIRVYFRDRSEQEKQLEAEKGLGHLWLKNTSCISTQVLNEYYVTVTQ